MNNDSSVDVLICGAGAAGLTLAIDLARRGVAFRLIEKRDAPFPGSRGKGLQPRTQEVFEDLGLIDRITATGGPYPPSREYRADGSHADADSIEAAPPTPSEPYRSAWMVPQFLTEAVLRERLAELGASPAWGCTLVGFEQDDSGVTAHLRGPDGDAACRARFLVGADGGRSSVRQALDINFPGQTLGMRAVVADIVLSGLSRDAWHRFGGAGPGQRMALCPLAGTELFQLQAPIALEGEVDLSAAALTAMISARTGRTDIVAHAVVWASAYGMNARLADRYRAGGAFLVGDAAHVHPPTGGQGLNTSVQDAYNLGWKLAAVLAGADDGLLDSYEEERRPVAAGMLGLSTRLLEAAKRGDMRRGRETHQLDIGYAGSSLALEEPERTGGLRAGDRAPDAPLRGAGGQATRVFELLRGPHWTLLGREIDRSVIGARRNLRIHAIGPRAEWRDEAGHFADAYALAPGDCVLVRPDGYVAAFVAIDRLDTLQAYLRRVGLGAG